MPGSVRRIQEEGACLRSRKTPALGSSRRCDGIWPILTPTGSHPPSSAWCAGRPPPRPPGRLDAGGRRAWLLVTGLLVAAALVGGVLVGAVAWSDDRAARGDTASPGPVATPACKTAVDRANAMLASAVKLRRALAEQDRLLADPANRGLPVGQLAEGLAAARQAAADESARFDRALEAYRQVVDRCDLRVT